MFKNLFRKKPKSIFLGRKVRKYWEINAPILSERTETLERIKILETKSNIEFNAGDEVYFKELGKYATIEKKTKDTDGNIIYNTTYVVETILDFDNDLKNKAEELKKQQDKARQIRENMGKIRDDKYKKFCEEKESIKKKGIIIQKVPRDLSFGRRITEHEKANVKFKEYDVFTTDNNLEIFNYDENGKIISIKDENIVFKN